ncbi:hypothetical protein [Halosimplex sp. TS25]|uniref:hypothetical protein n=1 Tax=Halosimplex rarum TaxID=3396619 RepID=UPI0039E751DE
MSDEAPPAEARVTRRGALALGGATLLAGCGVPGKLLGTGPVELDGPELRVVTSREAPAVSRPFPVEVAGSHVTASRERAYATLDAVPLPLTADEVPNGAMREEVADHAERARSRLAEAIEAPGVRDRLERLGDARGLARVAEGIWAVANDDLTAADVRSSRRSTREAIDAFREDWTYVGDDAVRALLVHDLVEGWGASARTAIEPDDRHAEGVVNALVVGERAGSVEGARATLADTEHVGDRFRESLTDPRSLRSTFADAHDSLASAVDSRLADLPGANADVSSMVDGDAEGTVAGQALADLHGDLHRESRRTSTDRPAGSVVEATESLARVRAFEALRNRIEADEYHTVQSAEDVQAIRSAAAEAVEDALAEGTDERLARAVLTGPVGWFDYVGRYVERYTGGDSVRLDLVDRDIALYVQIEVIAAATPAAVDEALAALGVE